MPNPPPVVGIEKPLDRQMLRILMLRLFLPTLLLIFLIFGALGYLWQRSLGGRQLQTSHSTALIVESFLDSAQRVMDSLAMVAEMVRPQALAATLNATRRAYSFFDTIYLLDPQGRIKLMAPYNPRYQNLDLSRQPYYRRALAHKGVYTSHPFTSLGTGQPTVYQARALAGGGMIVGELSLGALQQVVTRSMAVSGDSTVFVADSSGTLLVHSDIRLVQEQYNLGHLPIVQQGLKHDTSTIYDSDHGLMLGGAHPLSRLGWVVVTQQSLLSVLRPLLATAGPALVLALLLWLALLWALRARFRNQVSAPLGRLAATAEKIAAGSLDESAPVEGRNEIGALATAFNSMTTQLKRRIAIENLISGISRRFMEMDLGQAGEAIDAALGEIGRFVEVDRCCLFTFSPQQKTFSAAEGWCADGVEDHLATLQEMSTARLAWFIGRIRDLGMVEVPRVQDLGEEAAAEKELWTSLGIRSLLAVAMRRGRDLRGFVCLQALASERRWQPHEVRVLSLAAEVFNMALDRKRAEEALRRAEEDYRGIFEHASEGIFQATPEGHFLRSNPALARIYGYDSPQELMDNTRDIALDIYTDPAQRTELLGRVQEQGKVQGFEIEARRKDGSLVYVSLNARAVCDQQGRMLFIEGTAQDITARKLAERAREELEAQLRQAQKMEAVGTLAGGIAHDFNNILQAISGYCQLMQEDSQPESRQGRRLAQIAQAVDRAAELVRRLLTFSRKLEPNLRPLNLNREVTQACAMLERTLPKMIRIETDLTPGLAPMVGDSTQMNQILINLGSNAGDAMPDGGQLNISTRCERVTDGDGGRSRRVPPGEYVVLTVADTGVGMDEETRKHIFDPFYTTKEVGKGTGLGLSMVYGIVTSHGGHIVCESSPGAGATFTMRFPAGGLAEGDRQDQDASPPPGRGGGETILLVDDELAIREMGSEFFHRQGYQVLTAASGEEALAIYDECRQGVDLLVLDMGMPGMGGKKTLAEFTRRNPKVRVIVASGYAASEVLEPGSDLRAVEYIPKPYRFTDLLRKVRESLGEPGNGGGPPGPES